jgi:hypothetical protein
MTGENKLGKMLSVALILAISACLEPYNAPDVKEIADFLVVDGFLNATDGSATVRLSHTIQLANDDSFPFEEGAQVAVKSENGAVMTLIEQDSGRYTADGMVIDPLLKYQLSVLTDNGEEYFSDFAKVTETPAIDSLSWSQVKDGLQVYAGTHDNTGNSRYYRWSYVETWEHHAPFLSGYKVVNNTVIYREPNEFFFECYKSAPSTTIMVESTERLDADVVSEFPIVYIPRVSDRISVMYHIKVQQRVIEKKEFEFWDDLERVTETLGGLFDSQPYEIIGNVHNLTNPEAPVLGYFSAGKVANKEMFIDYNDLTRDLQKRPFHGCMLDTVCIFNDPARQCRFTISTLPGKTYLIGSLSESGVIWGFTTASEPCSDCRKDGGSLEKPAFWP